jgi:hypothetical protein
MNTTIELVDEKMVTAEKRGNAGFVLTEHLGGMLFYLIMLALAAGIIAMLYNYSKMSVTQQSLSTLAMNVQGLYSGQATYDGLSNSVAMNAGVVPKKFISGTAIKNPWGGAVTIAPGSDNGTFTITLAGIKQEDCIKLATYQSDYWESVKVGTSTITSVSEAATACTAGSNSLVYSQR